MPLVAPFKLGNAESTSFPLENADPFLSSNGLSWYRVSRLGEGTSATVYLANTNGTQGLPLQVAVKSSFLPNSFFLQHEKQVLSDLKECSDIIRCYGEEITETRDGRRVYNILLEYCSGLSVWRKVETNGRMPEVLVRSYTRDVVRGLKYMHAHGYAHCDIKPENILLVPSSSSEYGFAAKIADFGLAKKIGEGWDTDAIGQVRGTLSYMSPELIRESRLDYPVDIWALGCSIVEMLNGEPAWDCFDCDQLIEEICCRNRIPEVKCWVKNYISEECKDLIGKCLEREVAERWSAEMLMNHPFLAPK